MVEKGERWPPVYDLDDLVAEIKKLVARPDIETSFYDWRLDRAMEAVEDVCQGDLLELQCEVPVILEDGSPGIVEHPDGIWLVIGNTCDISRPASQTPWTQIVPVISLGLVKELSHTQVDAARKYTQSRSFFVPPWSPASQAHIHHADFLRPVALDKGVLGAQPAKAIVQARMSRAAWILLNACLVRFLARDDGRYD